MRIGIIGAGWLGSTVGRNWIRAGHEVMFSTRHPDRLKAMVQQLGENALAGTPQQAAAFGPVVLISVPYQMIADIGKDYAQELAGKIVLDASNPGPIGGMEYLPESEAIGVGALTARLLPGVRIVRAFSAVDATEIEVSYAKASGKLGVPVASDDPDALEVATKLVIDAGCEPLVLGGLAAARWFQRGNPGFRANTTLAHLKRMLSQRAS